MTGPRRKSVDPDLAAPIFIAANHGTIGGGEVMLLRIARCLQQQSVDVRVVAPALPNQTADAARSLGLPTVELDAHDRRSWMRALRHWDRTERVGVLWCNGLSAAFATAGHARRIVHAHQKPRGAQRPLAEIARFGSLATLVPSSDTLTALPGATVFPNWTDSFPQGARRSRAGHPFTLGFLGRPSPAKGVVVLLDALRQLDAQHPGRYRLILAGEPHFITAADRDRVERVVIGVEHLVDRPGWVDPATFFSQIDVLTVPSVAPESFGLVAAEAMAARMPVIVSDAGALPEVVGADHPLVVAAGDPVALARSIEALADGRLPDSVDQLYRRWQERFSPEAGAARVAELLRTLPLTRRGSLSDEPVAGADR